MNKEKLHIFDTTLRDGEQSAGASMTVAEKIMIAQQLDRLRVDVIEAGFPASSPGELDAVRRTGVAVKNATVCALARTVDADIDAALEALCTARRGRLHTFIATSQLHMRRKLGIDEQDVIARAVAAVKRARNGIDDVEFSPEDAGRSEPDFLCRVVEATIRAGATTINIPDTVGYTLPDEFAALVGDIMQRVPNSDKAVFSVHCHNDLGLAVANSLAAVNAGARQVECTVNGIGERAGNTSLEELVMAMRTRAGKFTCKTGIDTRQLLSSSRLVSSVTGMLVAPNKAVVGTNAFVHESGIHQDGVLKNRKTYEIMRAEDVGWVSNKIQLGKLSGRRAFKARLAELGISLAGDEELAEAFARFKDLADRKRNVYDEDLLALVSGSTAKKSYELLSWSFSSGANSKPKAELVIRLPDGLERSASATGDGQVDAAFKAVDKLSGIPVNLENYSVQAITGGTDALGEVSVKISAGRLTVAGHGTDTDIIAASAKAYLDALSRMFVAGARRHPQHQHDTALAGSAGGVSG